MKITIIDKELMQKLLITRISIRKLGTTVLNRPIYQIEAVMGDRNMNLDLRQTQAVYKETAEIQAIMNSGQEITSENMTRSDMIDLCLSNDTGFHSLRIALEGIDAHDLTHAHHHGQDKEALTLICVPWPHTVDEINTAYSGENNASDGFDGEDQKNIWIAAHASTQSPT